MSSISVRTLNWPRLVVSLAISLGAGAIGSIFTSRSVSAWYPTLEKPPFNPPSWVYSPVWTTLYALMGFAEYLVSQRAAEDARYQEVARRAQRLYGVQLGLNVGWSALFFGLRSPLAALIEIFLLWIAIIATIRAFAAVSRPAALLLVPYLLWTTFAAVLNASIWWLNRSDGG